MFVRLFRPAALAALAVTVVAIGACSTSDAKGTGQPGGGSNTPPAALAVGAACVQKDTCVIGAACILGVCRPICYDPNRDPGPGPRPSGSPRTCPTGFACYFTAPDYTTRSISSYLGEYLFSSDAFCLKDCTSSGTCASDSKCIATGDQTKVCFPKDVRETACEDFKVIASCNPTLGVHACPVTPESGTQCGGGKACTVAAICTNPGCQCQQGFSERCCNGEPAEPNRAETPGDQLSAEDTDCRKRVIRGDAPLRPAGDTAFYYYCESNSVAPVRNPGCSGSPALVQGECRCRDGRKIASPCATTQTCEEQCAGGAGDGGTDAGL